MHRKRPPAEQVLRTAGCSVALGSLNNSMLTGGMQQFYCTSMERKAQASCMNSSRETGAGGVIAAGKDNGESTGNARRSLEGREEVLPTPYAEPQEASQKPVWSVLVP